MYMGVWLSSLAWNTFQGLHSQRTLTLPPQEPSTAPWPTGYQNRFKCSYTVDISPTKHYDLISRRIPKLTFRKIAEKKPQINSNNNNNKKSPNNLGIV